MGGIYILCEWTMRFSVINVLWLIFNLPIVYILISILFAEQTSNVYVLLPFLIVFMPLLFYPATTAMFASVRDWVLNKDSNGLIINYLRYYKENYKNSFIAGIILTGLWLIWAVDYYYFSRENIVLMFAFIIMGTILFVCTMNFFSITAHFQMKLTAILKNSLLITIGSPLLSFSILLSSGIILLMSFRTFPYFIPFFTWSLLAFLSFSAFYRLYSKLIRIEK